MHTYFMIQGSSCYHYPSLGGVCTRFVLTAFEGTTQGQYWSIQEGACGTVPALVWRTTRYISLGDRLPHLYFHGNFSAVETIGSKWSYALTWCMPNNDDDDYTYIKNTVKSLLGVGLVM